MNRDKVGWCKTCKTVVIMSDHTCNNERRQGKRPRWTKTIRPRWRTYWR